MWFEGLALSLITETERRMLELVANGAPLSEVLNTLTQEIERISPESLCTIMLLDEEHRRRLLMASGPSLPQAYLQGVNGLEIGPEVGACGSAAFRNETVIIEDIGTDRRFEGARDFVLSHGLRSVWSQPVRDSKGSVLGTFAIYRRHVASPRPQELDLVRVAGQLAGNAIERIRAEKQLADAVKRLNLAERVARFGTWEADFQKNIVTVSAGLAALLERPPSRFQLTPFEFEALVHPDDRHTLWSSPEGRKPLPGTQQAEFRLVLPSGALRWMRSQWAFEPGANPPTRLTGAMIDVTNEKDMLVEAEQERAAAEASARVARQAERLEQDRKMILELVANDQPLEQVAATMAATVASHLPGSLCAIRIQLPDDNRSTAEGTPRSADGATRDDRISLYPEFPRALAEACERVDLSSIKETLTAAPLERLSDAADWSRYLQVATQEPHRLYRAVPVVRDSRRVGIILSLLREECADSLPQQKLLESWGRFASLAVERRGLYKQLSFRAQYDSLTSLLNRASLYERLSGLMRGGSGVGGVGGGSLGIIYLDLDSFKEINDTLGHGAGDVVLKHAARQIVASVRRTDVVARIGGDEFVIVLPGVADRGEVVQVADNVAAAITVPVDVENRLFAVSASLGISLYPLDGADTDTLLKVADESMYKVKLTHRSRRASEAGGKAIIGSGIASHAESGIPRVPAARGGPGASGRR
jgi:diguanylate cyclase (GGDEF)-like protein